MYEIKKQFRSVIGLEVENVEMTAQHRKFQLVG